MGGRVVAELRRHYPENTLNVGRDEDTDSPLELQLSLNTASFPAAVQVVMAIMEGNAAAPRLLADLFRPWMHLVGEEAQENCECSPQ